MSEVVGQSSRGHERGRRAGHEKEKDGSETNGETPSPAKASASPEAMAGRSEGKRETEAKEQKRRREEEAEKHREEVRKNLEKKFHGKKLSQVSFKESKELLEIHSRLRDEKDVIVNPKQLKHYKNLLVESGFDAKVVDGMSAGEIEVYAIEVLKQRG